MPSMLNNFFRHSTVVAVIAGALGSIPGAIYTYYATLSIEKKKLDIDKAQKFDASTKDILDAAREFVDLLNQNKDLNPAKSKLRTVLANQLFEISILTSPPGRDLGPLLLQYREAVSDFNNFSQGTISIADVGRWAEKFGKLLDLKAEIGRNLQRA